MRAAVYRQQRLVNFLLLDSSVPVAVPKVNDCHSFAQVVALLSETQRSQVLGEYEEPSFRV